MPDKKRNKKPAPPTAPVKYEAKVGLASGTTGKTFQPGDIVTTEDFGEAVLAHWAEMGRVVAL